MSELGNSIEQLRGKRSRVAFAKAVGVSYRLIYKAEAGDRIRLDTVFKIADQCAVSGATRTDLVIKWVKLVIGKEAEWLEISYKGPGGVAHANSPLSAEIHKKIKNLPRPDQQQVLKLLERPGLLKAVKAINDLCALSLKP